MKYLVIDASLNGTGIRNQYAGGYINPEDLQLSSETTNRLKEWLLKYESEHFKGYKNIELIKRLDAEGKEIARLIKGELTTIKMAYYSDALMVKELVD
jgi:hypothetical protein